MTPRTSSIFYIGKGKGRRLYQHGNEKEEIHSNTGKLKILKEISKAGHEVQHLIIANNLNEDGAFLLEKVLVFRLGRSIFEEGCLTNIVPGGRWKNNDSLFIKKEELPTKDEIEKYPELISVLEKYPHVAKEYTGIRCPNNPSDENIYVYDSTVKIYMFGLLTTLSSHLD